ncbi:hypothetical protein DFH06DRAFT_1149844 [Mycena polygramma]|nr:hypothetical protein DFH06DRAFT_1149844 [Mycena polygramma]
MRIWMSYASPTGEEVPFAIQVGRQLVIAPQWFPAAKTSWNGGLRTFNYSEQNLVEARITAVIRFGRHEGIEQVIASGSTNRGPFWPQGKKEGIAADMVRMEIDRIGIVLADSTLSSSKAEHHPRTAGRTEPRMVNRRRPPKSSAEAARSAAICNFEEQRWRTSRDGASGQPEGEETSKLMVVDGADIVPTPPGLSDRKQERKWPPNMKYIIGASAETHLLGTFSHYKKRYLRGRLLMQRSPYVHQGFEFSVVTIVLVDKSCRKIAEVAVISQELAEVALAMGPVGYAMETEPFLSEGQEIIGGCPTILKFLAKSAEGEVEESMGEPLLHRHVEFEVVRLLGLREHTPYRSASQDKCSGEGAGLGNRESSGGPIVLSGVAAR